MVGSSVMDSTTSPCLCLDVLPSGVKASAGGGELVSQRNSMKKRNYQVSSKVELGSVFVDSWHDWRASSKVLLNKANMKGLVSRNKQGKDGRSLVIVNELAGQYEDSFEDVKAVRI